MKRFESYGMLIGLFDRHHKNTFFETSFLNAKRAIPH
jgi:hypothetical protein